MDNETFLIGAYFGSAIVCTAIGWCAYLWLRGAMRALAARIPPGHLRDFLLRSFPPTLTLTAFAAFLSVSYCYDGCSMHPYHEIVASRPLLTHKVLAQFSGALRDTSYAVWAWLGLLSIIVVAITMKNSLHHPRN